MRVHVFLEKPMRSSVDSLIVTNHGTKDQSSVLPPPPPATLCLPHVSLSLSFVLSLSLSLSLSLFLSLSFSPRKRARTGGGGRRGGTGESTARKTDRRPKTAPLGGVFRPPRLGGPSPGSRTGTAACASPFQIQRGVARLRLYACTCRSVREAIE